MINGIFIFGIDLAFDENNNYKFNNKVDEGLDEVESIDDNVNIEKCIYTVFC